jgi:hypothetical protein
MLFPPSRLLYVTESRNLPERVIFVVVYCRTYPFLCVFSTFLKNKA